MGVFLCFLASNVFVCTTYIQEDKRTTTYLMDRIVAPFGAMPISFSPIAENRPNRQAKKKR